MVQFDAYLFFTSFAFESTLEAVIGLTAIRKTNPGNLGRLFRFPAKFSYAAEVESIEMKDGMESAAARPAPEPAHEEFINRKLIRPSLSTPAPRTEPVSERRERLERTDRVPGMKKVISPDQTHAENFYYQKQIQSKTPVVVVLKDGEQIQGYIEWYDRNCIKLSRHGASNLLLYKPSIRYMYKAGEGRPNNT